MDVGGQVDDGAAADIEVLELERIAALGWPGLRTEWLHGWLLRAGAGWTGRANAALPLRDAGADLDPMLDRVTRWYDAQGLPPLVQVPVPTLDGLRAQLHERGWVDRWGAVVMTADVPAVLATVTRRPELPPVRFADDPGDAWLAAYHYRGGHLPDVAIEVLRAGAEPRFLSVVDGGSTVAICRTSVAEGWIGITAVEVDDAHRRRGLATHMLVAALERARAAGVARAYLQTEHTNTAALALYARAGFALHHDYRYHGPRAVP